MRLVKKILGKVTQSHITEVKVVKQRQVDTGSIGLQADLVVAGGLRVLVPVLAAWHWSSGGGLEVSEGAVRRRWMAGSERLAGMSDKLQVHPSTGEAGNHCGFRQRL